MWKAKAWDMNFLQHLRAWRAHDNGIDGKICRTNSNGAGPLYMISFTNVAATSTSVVHLSVSVLAAAGQSCRGQQAVKRYLMRYSARN